MQEWISDALLIWPTRWPVVIVAKLDLSEVLNRVTHNPSGATDDAVARWNSSLVPQLEIELCNARTFLSCVVHRYVKNGATTPIRIDRIISVEIRGGQRNPRYKCTHYTDHDADWINAPEIRFKKIALSEPSEHRSCYTIVQINKEHLLYDQCFTFSTYVEWKIWLEKQKWTNRCYAIIQNTIVFIFP